MKKGNLKKFFKTNGGWFAFGIWIYLLVAIVMCFVEGGSTSIKITLIIVFAIYIVAGVAIMMRADYKREKQETQAKEERLFHLQERYKYYIDLVNAQVQETLKKFPKEWLSEFEINTSLEYLISFEDYKLWIYKNRNVEKLDSFIIASCLMYSIIDHPIIITNGTENILDLESSRFSINLDIAMNCVFQIISEPITYYYDNEDFCWRKRKNPKVNIFVPQGIISKIDLYQRIIDNIYFDDLEHKRTSIMQFSNLLHLIYLNCI